VPDRPGDMDERDVDARFASIVAHWDAPAPGSEDVATQPGPPAPTGVGSAAEAGSPDEAPATTELVDGSAAASADAVERDAVQADLAEPDAAEPDAVQPATPPPAPRSPWVNPSPLDVVVPPSAWRAAEPPDPDGPGLQEPDAALEEEHFEPPEVVLPPQEDLHFWGAVIGLVAGPLLLLWVVFARPAHSTRWFVISVAVSLLGFALLVLRQPTHRDPTSGDDGARV
jgi:hypothetical protein